MVAVVCNGRALDADGIPVGDPCGNTYTGPRVEVDARARAAGWKLGPVRPDGTRDVMCRGCGRPDPVTAALCRDIERSLT